MTERELSEEVQDREADGRVEHAEEAVIVHLREPLTFKRSKMDDEETVESLKLPRKIKAGHLKAMDKAEGEIGKTLALLAALTKVPQGALNDLDSRDLDTAMQAILPFLPKLPGTGRP